MMEILPGDLGGPAVIALLHAHLTSACAETAPGSAHALDLSALKAPAISLWTIWEVGALLGVGALQRLTQDHGEVKSMHTAQSMRRRGVGSMLLRHIISQARGAGLARLSLETGASEYFRPARMLYARHGFVPCPPFSSYLPDPNSVFMTLDLKMA